MNPNHTRFKLIKSPHNTDLSLDSDDLENSFLSNKSTFYQPSGCSSPLLFCRKFEKFGTN